MAYLPEGLLLDTPENAAAISSPAALLKAYEKGEILEGVVLRCDVEHNLVVRLGEMTGVIPRREAALDIDKQSTRDIEILSRVGKPVCFQITDIAHADGAPAKIRLSRRAVQARAAEFLLSRLVPGQVIRARVTNLEPFGVFVDIGCGLVSFISIENISVSRIFHPHDRFFAGQMIYAAVLETDAANRRITLTHKQLLGTWEQNAQYFSPGETVTGIVRGLEQYGMFIELRPNLSGLAEHRDGIAAGQRVSVYIKSILPERMKIKLAVIEPLPPAPEIQAPEYFISSGRISRWQYSPPSCRFKDIHTDFTLEKEE